MVGVAYLGVQAPPPELLAASPPELLAASPPDELPPEEAPPELLDAPASVVPPPLLLLEVVSSLHAASRPTSITAISQLHRLSYIVFSPERVLRGPAQV